MAKNITRKIKELPNKNILWHEYAPKGCVLLDCGQSEHANSIMCMDISTISPNVSLKETFVKCLGTNGKFTKVSNFGQKKLCKYCEERFGMLPAFFDTNSKHFAQTVLYSDTTEKISGSIIVPNDCPHAKKLVEHSDDFYKPEARLLTLPIQQTISHIHSWKIVYDNDRKLTLSIQYRTFTATKFKNVKTDTFYRHITLDIKNGQAFVSNIHNEKQTHNAHFGMPPIDNITYTGKSGLIFNRHKKAPSREEQNLVKPLQALYEALYTLLKSKGYNPVTPINIPTNEWKVINTYSNELLYELRDKLKQIVSLNRFPSLGCFPLLDPSLPLQIKRDISKLPRDITPDTIGKALGFDDKEIAAKIAQNPQKLAMLMVVTSSGCEDREALLECLEDTVYEGMMLAIINSRKNNTYNIYDLLSLVLPSMIGEGGWKQLFKTIGLNYSELLDALSTAAYFLEENQYLDLYNGIESYNTNNINYTFQNKQIQAYEQLLPPISTKTFKKKKMKWNIKREFSQKTTYDARPFLYYSTETYKLYNNNDDDEALKSFEISVSYSMDRRIWNKQTARDYANTCIKYRSISNEIDKIESTITDTNFTSSEKYNELKQERSKLEQKMEQYKNKMAKALSANPTRIFDISNTNNKWITQSKNYEYIQAIFKWTELNDIELHSVNVPSRYSSIEYRQALKNYRRRKRYAKKGQK